DGAVEQAARVEPQVQDEPADALAGQVGPDPLQVAGRVLGKARQPDVADLAGRVDHVGPLVVAVALPAEHRVDLAPAPGDVVLDRLLDALADDGQVDLGPRLAEDLLDGVVQRQALGLDHLGRVEGLALAVDLAGDLADDVTGQEALAVGRAALDG